LKEVESRLHFTNSSVVTGHIVEGHGLSELIVLAEFLRLLEEVKSTVDILFFKIINSKDVTDLA